MCEDLAVSGALRKSTTAPTDWAPDGDLLVISPHFDDAILSAYGLITSTLQRGCHVTILDVFTGAPNPEVQTSWDRLGGFANSTEALESRRSENIGAFDGLAVERVELGLLEGMYRPAAPTPLDRSTFADGIRHWMSKRHGTVLAPVGAGGPPTLLLRLRTHIPRTGLGIPGGAEPNADHLWVTDTLVETLHADGGQSALSRLAFYEDLPYLWAKSGDVRAAHLAASSACAAKERSVSVNTQEKARRIREYKSQVDGLFCNWVKDIANVLPKRERYWTLQSAPRSN